MITASVSAGILSVFGDGLDNTIKISRDAAGAILVNGGAIAISGGVPTVGTTTRIKVFGQSGNDTVTLDESNGALPRADLFGGAGNDTLTGGSGTDSLFGEAGNDALLGKGGADLLFGGGENDTLTGGDANDQLFGEAGDDRVIWNPGDDTDLNEGGGAIDTTEVNGGNGAEAFTLTANGTRVRFDRVNPAPFATDLGTTETLVLNMNGGDDTFSATGDLAALIGVTVDGGFGNDTILGGNGGDTLLGGEGNDTIGGRLGADTVFLGAGDDVAQWAPGDGSDTVEGQAGIDTMLFTGSAAAEAIDLSANGGRARLTRDLAAVTLDLDDMERTEIRASGGADRIHVGNMANTDVRQVVINLGTGGQQIGDLQVDEITVDGTAANDTITVGMASSEVVVGGLITAVALVNGEASDKLVLDGGAGNDTIDGAAVTAAAVTLSLRGGLGDDFLKGGAGADSFDGGDGTDILFGGAGDDTFEGGEGDDFIFGGAGDDVANTHTGGNDVFRGETGNDFFFGFTGNETFFGDVGNDTLKGFSGDDLLVGGTGADQISGGDGIDTVSFAGSKAAVNVLLEAGLGALGDAQGDTYDSVENAIGSAFADSLHGTAGGNRLQGGDGADFLQGRGGIDRLEGGIGDDILQGGAGGDILDGGAGNDTLSYEGSASGVQVLLAENLASGGDAASDIISNFENAGGSGFNDTLRGTTTANTLTGGSGQDTLIGLGGDDILVGGVGADKFDGGDGIDTVDYSASTQGVFMSFFGTGPGLGGDSQGDTFTGLENIIGSSLADNLHGASGTNRIEGRGGDDLLFGDQGSDLLIGGIGADSFVFFLNSDSGITATARDRILDFHVAEGDKIDLRAMDANAATPANDEFVFIGGDAFSGVGQARSFIEGDHTIVELNKDSTLAPEMQIELDGQVSLSAFDFFL